QDSAPACSTSCRSPNAYTGSCSCTADATAVSLPVFIPGGCRGDGQSDLSAQIGLCVRPGAPIRTFAGAYEMIDTGLVPQPCVTPNPLPAACSCPVGSVSHGYRLIVTVPTTVIPSGVAGGDIYLCW